MRKLSKMVSRLPLAGKLLTRPLAFAIYHRSGKDRMCAYLVLCLFIALGTVGHGIQATLGWEMAFFFKAPLWARLCATFYALVNSAVIIAQFDVLFRSTIFLCRSRDRGGKERSYAGFSWAETVMMLAITSTGQFAFCWLYIYHRAVH